jgi:hypothetical protein
MGETAKEIGMRTFFVYLILATAIAGFADSLYLKDGRIVGGTYLGGTARQVRMDLGDRVGSYDIADVARIEFQSAAAAAPAPSPKEREETRERPRLVRADPDSNAAQPASASSLTIPSGTVLKVRMIDGVDSETSQLGQTFQASLDDPIVVDGQTVVPRGADIVAKLVEDKQSGKISGRTELTLDLVSMRVTGKMIDLTTQEVTTSSGSRGAKSAKVIGGAAAVGAVLGGILGGGRGAAIGATSGAGAGGAVQVLTKGQRVKIPAETRLSFTLQNSVSI